jgi:hypothetical protein
MIIDNIPIQTDFIAYSYFADRFNLQKFDTAQEYLNSSSYRRIVMPKSALLSVKDKIIKNYIYSPHPDHFENLGLSMIRVEDDKVIEVYKLIDFPDLLRMKKCEYLVDKHNLENKDFRIRDIGITYNVNDKTENNPLEFYLYAFDGRELKFDYATCNLLETNNRIEIDNIKYDDHKELFDLKLDPKDLINIMYYSDRTYGRIYEFDIDIDIN